MTKKSRRNQLPFGHMIVETIDGPHGKTFAFYPSEALKAEKKSAFSAHIKKGMGDQLRLIASMFDYIEQKL